MKRPIVFIVAVLIAAAVPGIAATPADSNPAVQAERGNTSGGRAGLDAVLSKMDDTAKSFKTAQADLEQTQFTKVVNETDTQKGAIYFQRKGSSLEMMVNFKQPQEKYVLFSGNSLQVYQPSIEQVNKYELAQHRQEVDTFLTLGFGGRGHDLLKSFNVTFGGNETVGGVNAAKLQLVPKDPKVKSTASQILLWIDPNLGVSLQQQFFEPSGDYRLVKYSNIKLNQGLPANAFRLNTTSKTKVVTP